MPLDVAAAIREQMRLVARIAEKGAASEVRRELAAVAFVLAQLAETVGRSAKDRRADAP